ncbi:hypothetical protein [Crocosphaera sp.]|uniref:hypothetical protein n=1 Tax=Crocosphaera sp. TaxID=2729996 RepID=UPI002629875C|nr:hypothetical protein [Crocosphaera sp.]MDJ0579098.1 hypothetical protein [Crocosphaera sp.]
MINFNPLNSIIDDGFAILVDEFSQQQQEEIKSEKWDWPRVTHRIQGVGRTGQVASSPRDIVDTGELLDSLEINFINPHHAIYYWQSQHAIFVLMGQRYSNGTETPGRNWIESAMEEYSLLENFADILRSSL